MSTSFGTRPACGGRRPETAFSPQPGLDDLRERGIEHEQAYLEWLEAQGLQVAGADGHDPSLGTGLQATLAHMRSGVDVIYQGTLADDGWSGRPDFLRKVSTPSSLGEWSYEAYDAKLARETRAGAVLQLCVYSRSLQAVQGVQPARMHVVTPGRDFAPLSYRVDEYAAYSRLLSGEMRTFLDDRPETYPERVAHCDYCAWWVWLREASAARRPPVLRRRYIPRADRESPHLRRRAPRGPGWPRSGPGSPARLPYRADARSGPGSRAAARARHWPATP